MNIVIALTHLHDDRQKGARMAGVLAMVGTVNLPIIKFSVEWWNTLHQGASVSLTRAPSMATIMLVTMLIMAFAAWFYSIAVALWRVRTIILERERHTDWVAAELDRLAAKGKE